MRFEDNLVSTACGAALLALMLLVNGNPETAPQPPCATPVVVDPAARVACARPAEASIKRKPADDPY